MALIMQSKAISLRGWLAKSFPGPALRANSYRRPLASSARCSDADPRDSKGNVDVDELLSKPTWSVSSLLPTSGQLADTPTISSKQLHHLLRLSALPPPKNAEEEARMLSTLSSQLHFVKDVQQVDTTGVEPLRSLRDETLEGEKEAELDMEAMSEALSQEEVKGKYHKRIRRRRRVDVVEEERPTRETWDPLGTAGKKVGRFFVVEGGKDG